MELPVCKIYGAYIFVYIHTFLYHLSDTGGNSQYINILSKNKF